MSIQRLFNLPGSYRHMTNRQTKSPDDSTSTPKASTTAKKKAVRGKAIEKTVKPNTAKPKAVKSKTLVKAPSKAQVKTPVKSSAKTAVKAKSIGKKSTAPIKTSSKIAKPVATKTAAKKSASKTAAPNKAVTKPTKETVASLRLNMDKIVKRLETADKLTRKNVNSLETAFSTLEKQVKSHHTVNHAALARRVDQLSTHLTQSLDTVKTHISNDLKTALENPSVGGLEDAIARCETRLAEAENNQARSISKINKHIADLARIIDTRFTAHEGLTEDQSVKLIALEDQLTSIKSQSYERIRLVEDSTANAMRKIGDDVVGTAESFQAKLESQSDILRERIALIAERTQKDFDDQKVELSRRMESIEDSQKNQSSYVDRAISKLASRIDSLEYGLTQLPDPEPAIQVAGSALAATQTSEPAPQDDSFLLTPETALPPVSNITPDASNPYPTVNVSVPDVPEAVGDAFAAPPMPQHIPEAAPQPAYEAPVYEAPSYEAPTPYQAIPAEYASPAPMENGPQEYQPPQAAPQMALQHQYVDPVQAAYQASMQPGAAVAYDQAPAYEQYAAPQNPPFPPTQSQPYSYNADAGPTEFVADPGFADNELPYSNPGYGEGGQNDGVSRPGVVAEKRQKKKREKKDLNLSSALSALPITPRNLRVAGLALVVATAGYFGLRGLNNTADKPVQQVTEQANQPFMPAGATSDVITEAPIGDYADNQVPALTPQLGQPVASKSLEQAANDGDAIAQFQLGISYLDAGRPQQGLKFIRASANQGQPAAQYRLAKLYEAGVGVAADPDMARQLTERAARAGNRIAMHDLGLYYAEGRGGIERNMDTALSWFEKAAERGVVDSQYNLGVLFESSPEIPRNPVSSFVWYSVAASQGDQLAANRVGVIKKELSEGDLKLAQERVDQFKPTAIDEVANGIFRNVAWTMPEKIDIKPSATLVRDAQSLLGKLGYEVGVPDGDMGPKTRTAVKAFEKANGLPETGTISASLVDRLEAAAGV